MLRRRLAPSAEFMGTVGGTLRPHLGTDGHLPLTQQGSYEDMAEVSPPPFTPSDVFRQGNLPGYAEDKAGFLDRKDGYLE